MVLVSVVVLSLNMLVVAPSSSMSVAAMKWSSVRAQMASVVASSLRVCRRWSRRIHRGLTRGVCRRLPQRSHQCIGAAE
uniref:Secreted protein n=1 Tax=Oryza barthii TaxID=65489 RepID=A0A0D3H461_9ORYZ